MPVRAAGAAKRRCHGPDGCICPCAGATLGRGERNCRSRSGADWLFNVERSSQCKVQEAGGRVYIHTLCASGCLIEEAALRSSSRGVTRCFRRVGFYLFIFFGVTRSDFGKSSSRRRPGRASGRCSSRTPTRFLSESKNGSENKTRKIIK